MKKIVDDDRLIYKCCNLYYMKNKTQVEICNTLGLSRALYPGCWLSGGNREL